MDVIPVKPKKQKRDVMDFDFSDEEERARARGEEEEEEESGNENENANENEGEGEGETKVEDDEVQMVETEMANEERDENGSKDMTLDNEDEEEEKVSTDQTKEEDDTPRPTGEITEDMDIDEEEEAHEDEDFPAPILPKKVVQGVESQLQLRSPSLSPSTVHKNIEAAEDYQETPAFGPQGDTQVESQSQPRSQSRNGAGGSEPFSFADINNMMTSSMDEEDLSQIDIPATQVDYDIEAFNSAENGEFVRFLPEEEKFSFYQVPPLIR